MPSRRAFLKTLGAATTTAPFFARTLHAAAPSRVLRHASFGGGGMAASDITAIASNPWVKLVALADVDRSRIGEILQAFPDVKVYSDWRELLDREGRNLDSVNVSVPDHMHAPIAASAMQLGKHVYCQKPLAHDLYETRALTQLAREKKVVTQMGIQLHAHKVYRQAVALIQSGAIGKIREVHSWTFKRWGDTGAPPDRSDPIPETLNWDLWLGVAAARPYITDHYHPQNWRKRLDFGTGTFGDMGCHIIDPVFEALTLTAPLSLRSEGPPPDRWNWPSQSRIHYTFPGTRYTAEKTLRLTWYDGDAMPAPEIRALAKLPSRTEQEIDQGSLFIGTEGVMHLPHPHAPKLYPEEKYKDLVLPPAEQGHHWTEWAEACRTGAKPTTNFDYSGPLTEAVLLGSIAVRFPQTTLEWDTARLRFKNAPSANAFLRRQYRRGWEVRGL